LIVDIRKQTREHAPIHINGTAVERVSSFKFLCIHLTWTNNTTTFVKRAKAWNVMYTETLSIL
jgi:hypothetical protein